MFGLPVSTEVNRRVAKEKFYVHASLTPTARKSLKSQIESIVWHNKLADNTIGVASGKTVKEIQIFEISLRQRGLDKNVLTAIAKAIPYKILFVLTFGGEAQLWIEAADVFYNTDWISVAKLHLPFAGLNLDAVYENLARRISGGRLGTEGSIAEAVERDKMRQKLNRKIAALEKKVLREKQFNKQVELNGELKRLRKELEGLG
jgi:hypothetical protein